MVLLINFYIVSFYMTTSKNKKTKYIYSKKHYIAKTNGLNYSRNVSQNFFLLNLDFINYIRFLYRTYYLYISVSIYSNIYN